MNLTDVILDEKLLKDIFVILAKITKKAVQDEQI
jgi:hypothetical protein